MSWWPYSLARVGFDLDAVAGVLRGHFGTGLVMARPVSPTGEPADINGIYVWPMRRVRQKLGMTALALLLAEKRITGAGQPRAAQGEIAALAAHLRRVAEQWPFGDVEGPSRLLAEADRLDGRFAICECFISSKWPRTPARFAQFRAGLALYALSELRRAEHAIGCPRPTLTRDVVSRITYGPALTEWQRAQLDKALAEDSIDRRVRDFAKRIRRGTESDVMAWALSDLLSHRTAADGRVFLPLDLPTQIVHEPVFASAENPRIGRKLSA